MVTHSFQQLIDNSTPCNITLNYIVLFKVFKKLYNNLELLYFLIGYQQKITIVSYKNFYLFHSNDVERLGFLIDDSTLYYMTSQQKMLERNKHKMNQRTFVNFSKSLFIALSF